MEIYWQSFVDSFIKGIPNLLTALAIFILSLYLARILSNVLRRTLQKRRAPAGVIHLLSQLMLWSVVVAGIISALQRFFNVTAFLTGLGILGFTIGFALQDIMKNFASGVILLLQQPFHVGETIGVKGFDGTVLAIDLRATEMRAADGRVVILPNAEVLANPIVNFSRANHRRIDFTLNLPHTCEPRSVRKMVLEAIENVEGYVGTPEPVIVFNGITDHAMELNVNFWIDVTQNDLLHAKDQVLLEIKSMFNELGIEIPHPMQAVFNTQVSK